MNIWPEKRRKVILTANLTEKSIPVAFFDADNTLRCTRSKKPSPHGRHDVILIRETFRKLRELAEKAYFLAIVSNQAGIEQLHTSYPEVEEAFQETLRQFSEQGVIFNYYDFAEKKDNDRKPETGMALRLERKLKLVGHDIDWQNSFMVGDAGWKKDRDFRPDGSPGTDHSSSDRLFAENLAREHPGFLYFHAATYFVEG